MSGLTGIHLEVLCKPSSSFSVGSFTKFPVEEDKEVLRGENKVVFEGENESKFFFSIDLGVEVLVLIRPPLLLLSPYEDFLTGEGETGVTTAGGSLLSFCLMRRFEDGV